MNVLTRIANFLDQKVDELEKELEILKIKEKELIKRIEEKKNKAIQNTQRD